jgi:DNA-binding MurR/RpiR family transcriptional regulator
VTTSAKGRKRPSSPDEPATRSVSEQVRDRLEDLTPSERRVGRALLAAYPIAGLESLTRLADAAEVTGPTVLRFVRKLGYDGYPAFQHALRQEVQARMESPLSLYGSQMPAGPGEEVLEHSLRVLRRALDKTFRSVSAAEFRAVVALLADERRHAVFTGGRFSQLVAHYLYAQLRMLRPNCSLVGDSFDPRIDGLIDVGKNDVVCVFDYRRYQEDTVVFARRAADRGATVIVCTDPWLSPAAEVADHVLLSHPDAPSPFDSMLGAFAVTEALLAGVVERLGARGRERVEELEIARSAAELESFVSGGGAMPEPGGPAPGGPAPLKGGGRQRGRRA